MLLNGKQPSEIEESDLNYLIDNTVGESKTLEFKESLPGNSDSDKKEFLADVSSFANASGGVLIFGIKEKNGVAFQLRPIKSTDVDAEILRLENMIRTGIDPRIIGLSIVPIQVKGDAMIVVGISRSWSAPHMVTYKGHSKFYSRNSAGKYPLDVAELRAAFLLSNTLTENIREFRLERLGKIIATETTVRCFGFRSTTV